MANCVIVLKFQNTLSDSNPSSPASVPGRKEGKGRRKQSYPSKAPFSPVEYHQESIDMQPQQFNTWSGKIKKEVGFLKIFQKYINLYLKINFIYSKFIQH